MSEFPILAINCGSSSLKFGVFDVRENLISLARGVVEEIGHPESHFTIEVAGSKRQEEVPADNHETALSVALDALKNGGMGDPCAIAHRIVHGGPHLREHSLLNESVLRDLETAADFAPLHVPAALAVLRDMSRRLPSAPQAICLDTAFHRNMPDVACTYALPKNVRALGVQRYGFHGLSCESILAQLKTVPDRVVIAHLGNGCSVTAVLRGMSIDTTMGLTPTGGVMMGTRCGDLDPGISVFLMRNGFSDAGQLERIFDHESGLRGVSGQSSDVRDLLAARKSHPAADLALRIFSYQLRKAVSSMAGALGGLDLLVFSGGIGEHAHELRDEICSGLTFLPPHKTQVLQAQEEIQMARITKVLIANQAGSSRS